MQLVVNLHALRNMIRCDHRFISSSITQTTTSSYMSVRNKSYYGKAEYSEKYGDYTITPLGNYDVPTGWPMKLFFDYKHMYKINYRNAEKK